MTRVLIKAGWAVTMDEKIGDVRNAEILVEGEKILAVGHDLNATADEVVDASEMIVMPGLVNAHIHVWQCGLRGIGSEWMGPDYHTHIHGNIATFYRPEDNYLGNLIGSLTQIDGGVTTVLDWSHNLTSLEQAERSIDALEETGIRAVFAHGTAKPPTAPGGVPYTHIPHPRDRIEALRRGRLASDDARVTLAMAILGPHY
ncbi:MAG: amidohydrolase family protein, partial [Ferrovibrionaceae bacterium]